MVDTDDTRRTTDKATGIWLPTGELKRYGDANKLNKALLSLQWKHLFPSGINLT